jgi:hypothetical protein
MIQLRVSTPPPPRAVPALNNGGRKKKDAAPTFRACPERSGRVGTCRAKARRYESARRSLPFVTTTVLGDRQEGRGSRLDRPGPGDDAVGDAHEQRQFPGAVMATGA